MGKRFINGTDLIQMMELGARNLQAREAEINALNVFPVPDGDTGTNMSLTARYAVDSVPRPVSAHLGQAAAQLSRGLLIGARGNSGVILSQLFRGFAEHLAELEQAGAVQFAEALQKGVEAAYRAVGKPVEGTILTVARETAMEAALFARQSAELDGLMELIANRSKASLLRTPELMPLLKQVGVVDSGGLGLVVLYESFFEALADGAGALVLNAVTADMSVQKNDQRADFSAQSCFTADDIEYLYDMEFLIYSRSPSPPFDEPDYRAFLERNGNSIVIAIHDDIIKVHVHTRIPGDVLNEALKYGELSQFSIVNMRDQHRQLLGNNPNTASFAASPTPAAAVEAQSERSQMVAVSSGSGISDIFLSLGVGRIVPGGTTMNPSIEQLLQAIEEASSDQVYILPNHTNCILCANQARELVADKTVIVIPSRSIQQGIAAAVAFDKNETIAHNTAAMLQAMHAVRTGQVTQSTRDTILDEVTIQKDQFIGICDGTIVSADTDLIESCEKLLDAMIDEQTEMITIITGVDATAEHTASLQQYVRTRWSIDIEVCYGGQPLYPYLFSVE